MTTGVRDEWSANARLRMRVIGLVLRVKGSTCHLCGGPNATSADHLIPRSQGGACWDLANLAPCHTSCNYSRGDQSLADWFATHPLPNTAQPTRARCAPSRTW